MVTARGGSSLPDETPSIFDFPLSCITTEKPPQREKKVDFAKQSFFDRKENIESFSKFSL